jgi:hypothetical protein
MSTSNLDAHDLAAVAYGGLINEEVMQTIFDISPVDLPYIDMADEADSQNAYTEWTQDSLAAVDLTNALVDGVDATGNNTKTGKRLGNHHQISDKVVRVSDRAQSSDVIGQANALVYQLIQRQKELKRDMEAILLTNQASVADDGDSTAGKTAGVGAMFTTAANIIHGTTGGFSAGIYSAPTPSTAAALSEGTHLRPAIKAAYEAGGNVTSLMSTPTMIGLISDYLFTSSARIATLTSTDTDVNQGKYGIQGIKAVGAVNVYVTNFGTLELVPNRTQQVYDNGGTDCVNLYGLDPDYWAVSYLQRIQTKPLARTGTADNRQMTVDYCNIAKNEESSFVIMGINPATAVVT